MEQPPTCGQGLAHHAALPAALANLMGAVASTLEFHLTALDPSDKGSEPEFDAYVVLAAEHRALELRLRALAVHREPRTGTAAPRTQNREP